MTARYGAGTRLFLPILVSAIAAVSIMASRPEPEKEDVYLAYRNIFHGSKARVRNRKVIRGIVLRNWARSGITPDEQHLTKTISVLQALLKTRVFECEGQARKAIPSAFAKSPPVSHALARLDTRHVTSVKSTDTDHKRRTDDGISLAPHVLLGTPIVEESQLMRFPFEAQHHVLSRVQQLLEETCFQFLERWLPATLIRYNWICAAAIELTKSLSIIKKKIKKLPDGCMDTPQKTLFLQIAPDIAQLRHSAVHRLHLEHDKFLQRINCACTLAELLQHPENRDILKALYSQVDALVKKLEYETKVVKQKADCILSQLSQQREMLVQREIQLRDRVAKKYIELATAAGRGVFEPIEALPFTGGSDSMQKRDGPPRTVDFGAIVDENDIESDEDRLQAELG